MSIRLFYWEAPQISKAIIGVTAILLFSGSTAWAQAANTEPTPAQVRAASEAFDRGTQAYQSEEYVVAAEQFESADQNAPSSGALELAIRSRDKAGQLDRAATLAALAVIRYPDDPSLQKVVPGILERANQELHKLSIRCPQACELLLDNKLVHSAPVAERTLYVNPGKVSVKAGWADRSETKTAEGPAASTHELVFGESQKPVERIETVELPPPDEGTPDPAAANAKNGWPPTVAVVMGGLTVVSLGYTIWSGVDTLYNPGPDRVKERCSLTHPDNMQDCPEYQQGLANERRTNFAIGVTSALTVATLAIGYFATDWSQPVFGGGKPDPDAKNAKQKLRILPYATYERGASIGVVGRF